MKIKELKTKSEEELIAELDNLKKESFNLRFQQATSQVREYFSRSAGQASCSQSKNITLREKKLIWPKEWRANSYAKKNFTRDCY